MEPARRELEDARQSVARPRYVSATARKHAPVANWLARKPTTSETSAAAKNVQTSSSSSVPELLQREGHPAGSRGRSRYSRSRAAPGPARRRRGRFARTCRSSGRRSSATRRGSRRCRAVEAREAARSRRPTLKRVSRGAAAPSALLAAEQHRPRDGVRAEALAHARRARRRAPPLRRSNGSASCMGSSSSRLATAMPTSVRPRRSISRHRRREQPARRREDRVRSPRSRAAACASASPARSRRSAAGARRCGRRGRRRASGA